MGMDYKNDKIALLKTFSLAIEASMAKSKLDAYGIPCFLVNEDSAGIYAIPVNLSLGVRLMVFEEDIERANEILNEQ